MKFSVFQLSRIGGREKNEDRMGYSYTREAGLFVLADGMGGHPEGEVAAEIAVQTVSAQFQREARPRLERPADHLNTCVMAAHHQIIRYAARTGLLDTPRTTLVAAVVQANQLYWVHCGDSRLYVVRDGQLLMRTRDHSYLEAHASAGNLPENVNRNVLFTCLGSTIRPLYDVSGPLKLEPGDKVLLCSDGLWGTLSDEQIVHMLAAAPVAEAVPALVDQALQIAGASSDNVTVLAFDWAVKKRPSGDRPSGFTETEGLDDSVFASTIMPGGDVLASDELDDEAIERAIAEINAAIQRSGGAGKGPGGKS